MLDSRRLGDLVTAHEREEVSRRLGDLSSSEPALLGVGRRVGRLMPERNHEKSEGSWATRGWLDA